VIGNSCGKHGGRIKHRGFLSGNLKENETTRIGREVFLKWSVRMSDGVTRTGIIWFRIGTNDEEFRKPKKSGDLLD
jgi:hypothetical protein